jgi:hypothetical protein
LESTALQVDTAPSVNHAGDNGTQLTIPVGSSDLIYGLTGPFEYGLGYERLIMFMTPPAFQL